MKKSQEELPSDQEIFAAKEVLAAFLMAMKNYDLYPHEHASSQNLLSGIHARLDNFLSRYRELKVIVEQNRLLYKTVPIYEKQSSDDNFAFFLYRDGLLWIEFLAGLTLEEIKTFFSILNKYKVLHDEPEDDIVTALWGVNMAHIKYEAKELFFDDVPLLDFSMLNKVAVNEAGESDTDKASGAAIETGNILDMVPEEGHQQWWSLSKEEFGLLGEMVREAEINVRKGDVLQVLFFVLTKQDNADDFGVVLDFLKEEWREEIYKGNFERIVRQLTVLRKQKESPPQGREWIPELMSRFFGDISEEVFLAGLKPALERLDGNVPEQVAMFRNFLLLLEPKALTSLGNLLPYIRTQVVLNALLGVMLRLGERDLSALKELLKNENDLIVLKANQILSKISGEEPAKLVASCLQHSSAKVRRSALRYYIETNSPCLEEIFTIIDDPDLTTRSIFLSFLGRERNEKAEKLLLQYLASKSQQNMDEDHLNNCYIALGRCGSELSLPFLKKILLGQGWKSMLNGGTIAQQHGAIKALLKLRVEGATEVLKKGAACLHPGLRKSCRGALSNKGLGA